MTDTKTSPMLSVLVPIYNTSRYLRQCLDSVIRQRHVDMEIICINDGSTDDSLDIIRDYAARDPRIVIIDKPNSGYGDSMNHGLDAAQGRYIGIVESDDWVDPTMFEDLVNLAEDNHAQAVKSNFFHYLSKGEKSIKFDLINAVQAFRITDPSKNPYIFFQMAAIWAGIYRHDFLVEQDIRFLPTPGASYQDTSFNFKVWATAHRVIFTNKAYLHYRIDNEASSINSKSKVYCVFDELHEIDRFVQERGLVEDLGGIVVQRKIDIYSWNLSRLRGQDAVDFAKAVSREFKQITADRLVDFTILGEVDTYKFKTLRDDPRAYLDSLAKETAPPPISRRLRDKAHRLLEKVSPTYHSQVHMSEQMDRMAWRNEELLADLRRIQNRLDAMTRGTSHDAH